MLLWKVALEFWHPMYSTDLPIAREVSIHHSWTLTSKATSVIMQIDSFQDLVLFRYFSDHQLLSLHFSHPCSLLNPVLAFYVIRTLSNFSQVWWTVSFLLNLFAKLSAALTYCVIDWQPTFLSVHSFHQCTKLPSISSPMGFLQNVHH